MSRVYQWVAVLGLAAGLLAVGLQLAGSKSKRVAVVDLVRLFDAFAMKKDLEQRAGIKLQALAQNIDSLQAIAQVQTSGSGASFFQGRLDSLRTDAQRAYQTANETISQQVWTRLNALMERYGKENGFDVLIGSNGMGTVLYAADAVNKTEEVIQYVNAKYETGH
ncbi:MAG: OmpH family outer membrane protein [Sphingobacteriales bacterium]|nr:MAG: OmpH family outer membrane protein [Sphingobacteriales bacterium]